MHRIASILVIVDPTATTHPAVDKALLLALRLQSQVELFVCDYRAGLDAAAAEGARTTLLEHRRAALNDLAAPLRTAGLQVTVDAAFDNPLHEGLLRKIARAQADLVIKDTHYHNLMRRTLITNTDWHLIRACASPLLLVKPTHWSTELCTLAALDPGHAADEHNALDHSLCEWSVRLAQALNGQAHAVHMYFPHSLLLANVAAAGMPIPAATGAEQEIMEEERRARLQRVQSIATPHGIPAEHTRLTLGSAVDLLAEEAERVRADIVVMGAVSRSRLQRIFVGHTAERVLDHLPCDVLVVKPADFTGETTP